MRVVAQAPLGGAGVDGGIRQTADTWAAKRVMRTPEDAWWNERSALLEEMTAGVDWAARWSLVTELERSGAFAQSERDPDDATCYLEREALAAFAFGLDRLLDGIDAYLSTRTPHDRLRHDQP